MAAADASGMSEKKSRVGVPPFLAWRKSLNLSRTEAAKLLGRTERQIQVYDALPELPQLLRIATLALEHFPVWRLRELGIEPFWRRR